jgi:hypothetical protein
MYDVRHQEVNRKYKDKIGGGSLHIEPGVHAGYQEQHFFGLHGNTHISVLPSLSFADAYISIDTYFLYSVWSCDQTMNGVNSQYGSDEPR